MARRGWSTSNFLRYAAGLITAAPLTIAAWAKTSITGSNQRIAGLWTSGSTATVNTFQLLVTSANVVDAFTGDGVGSSAALSSTTISANTWFHACAVFASATDRRAFLNGGGKGTNAVSRVPSGINRTSIGVGDGSAAALPFAPSGTGDIAEVAMWNVALTDAEVASLANAIPPFLVRPASLVAYWPLIGVHSPEINLKSNTVVQSVQGTLSQAAHPRIFRMPRRRLIAA